MNVDVNINLKLDLSSLFVEMLWNVLVRIPNDREQALEERIRSAVELAVQDRLRSSTRPAPAPAPAPVAPEPTRQPKPPGQKPAASLSRAASVAKEAAVWTEERYAVLVRDYPAGVALDEIVRRVNDLPGPTVEQKALKNKAFRRGLRRPDPAGDQVDAEPVEATPAESVAPVVAPEPEPEPEPVVPPPATSPAPEAATIPMWSAEKLAVLDFYYRAGDGIPDIIERLNAFPGPPITERQIGVQIVARRLRRDATLPAAIVEKTSETAGIATEDANIRRWAGERGLCSGAEPLDMKRINAKRVQLGLPPFARLVGFGQSGATMRPGAAR